MAHTEDVFCPNYAAIHFDQGEKNYPHHLSQGKAKLVRETIKTIETSTYNPALISLNR